MSSPLVLLKTRIYRHLGWQVIITLGSLAAILSIVIYGISAVLRDIHPLSMLGWVLGALLVAWILHLLNLKGWVAAAFLLVIGVTNIFIGIGRIGQPLLSLLRAFSQLRLAYSETLGWQLFLGELLESWTRLMIAVLGLAERFSTWVGGLFSGQAVYDPLASAMVWSLSAWLMAAWLGWWVLRKQNVVVGLIPVLSLFTWLQYYTRASVHLLLVALGLGIALHILTLHFKHLQRWGKSGLVPTDDWWTLYLVIALTVGGLSFSALTVTNFSLKPIQDIVSSWFEPQEPIAPLNDFVEEALGLQVQPDQNRDLFGNPWKPALPSQHLLTDGPELSSTVVMSILLEDEPVPIYAGDPMSAEPVRYYWRSVAYNRYSGRGWYSDETVITGYEAGEMLFADPDGNISLLPAERLVHQEFLVFRPGGGLVYHLGDLVTVDQDYAVGWRRAGVQGDALGAVVESNDYRVLSRITEASSTSLRQSGTNYPNWVLARYLALPENIPNRVRNLALDLTAAQPTPFDRAQALETYLRQTYPYTLDLPPLPLNIDLVDYFLFDLQQGYCDYYASAMVVMARAAGLPARLATGYAGGAWDNRSGRIIVTEAEAHSWAEIYFPGYGWIRFEPTAGRPAIDRQDTSPQEINDSEDLRVIQNPLDFLDWTTRIAMILKQVWGWLFLLAVFILYLLFYLDRWFLRWRSPLEAITVIYRRIYRQAFHLGVIPGPGGTLSEFSQDLTQMLNALASKEGSNVHLERLADDVVRLSSVFEQALFSQRSLDRSDQKQCIKIWQRMRARFWLARLLHSTLSWRIFRLSRSRSNYGSTGERRSATKPPPTL